MTLWRISRHHELSGAGGLRAPGRWHERGLPIVYLAETTSGALLETCVHTSANDVPPSYTLLAVQVPTQVAQEDLSMTTLPPDWVDHVEVTRKAGSEWLRSLRSALLRVSSALVPETSNLLLNPLHPVAGQVRIEAAYDYPFDPRFKR